MSVLAPTQTGPYNVTACPNGKTTTSNFCFTNANGIPTNDDRTTWAVYSLLGNGPSCVLRCFRDGVNFKWPFTADVLTDLCAYKPNFNFGSICVAGECGPYNNISPAQSEIDLGKSLSILENISVLCTQLTKKKYDYDYDRICSVKTSANPEKQWCKSQGKCAHTDGCGEESWWNKYFGHHSS
ncbi:hypothetical protein HDU98_010781 [Podochytrium sp. JEL0797]|nr:hypothetical protein HDU98_010781 [Podochytrium sp. JEL0797]